MVGILLYHLAKYIKFRAEKVMPNKTLSHELKEHMPFTMLGAATGIALMLIFNRLIKVEGLVLFKIFHPLHVVLSAYATTLLFRRRSPCSSVIKVILVGYIGSIGVATVSDSIIPYCGERIMGISVPTHHHSHDESEQAKPGLSASPESIAKTIDVDIDANESTENHPRFIPGKPNVHIGFIEDWFIVNSSAFFGILLGFLWNSGRLPHTSHVLISTWASMAHIMMNTATALTPLNYIGIFVVLFLAVWLPCCFSDIVFPTLFSLKDFDTHNCNAH